jgi:hypothetical protein
MANSISVNAQLVLNLAAGGSISGTASQTNSQTGTHGIENVQNIGTTAEALVLGDLANAAFVLFKNLDATNYVEVDAASAMTSFPQKVLPGGFILLSPETITIYAKAHTAACDCLIVACEL